MTIQDLGSIGELVSSVAVLITLIYLAIQVKQNTVMMRNAASQSTASAGREVALATMASPEMAKIFVKLSAGEELNPEEQIHRLMWCQATLRALESYYMHWKSGLVDDEFWATRKNGATSILGTLTEEIWASVKSQYDTGFVDFVDELWKESAT